MNRTSFINETVHDYARIKHLTIDQENNLKNWATEDQNEEQAAHLLASFEPATLPSKRFHYPLAAPRRDQLINKMVQIVYQNSPEILIQRVEEVNPFYSRIRNATSIHIPSAISTTLKIINIPISIFLAYHSYFIGLNLAQSINLSVGKAMPFIINKTPVTIIRIFNSSMNLLQQARASVTCVNLVLIYSIEWIFNERISRIPYIGTIWKITIQVLKTFCWIEILSCPESLSLFLFFESIGMFIFFLKMAKTMHLFFDQLAENAKSNRLEVARQTTYQLFIEQPFHQPQLQAVG